MRIQGNIFPSALFLFAAAIFAAEPCPDGMRSLKREELPRLIEIHGGQFDKGVVPLLLVHGDHGEQDDKCGGWGAFLRSAPSDFLDTFKVFIFMHDSSKPVGFDGSPATNAGQLGTAIASAFGPAEQIAIVAHSRGGLVSRAYMNRFGSRREGDRVIRLITLGTPHHGTPSAVPDWGLYMLDKRHWLNTTCFANRLYNITEDTVPVCTMLAKAQYDEPQMNVFRYGTIDLGWDNFDSSSNGIPTQTFRLDVTGLSSLSVPMALGTRHTVSPADANIINRLTPSSMDGDIHGVPSTGSLAQLNLDERYRHKILTYGGYYSKPLTNITLAELLLKKIPGIVGLHWLDDHDNLSYAGRLLGAFPSNEQKRCNIQGGTTAAFDCAYVANDGLVPLQSALFLSAGEDPPVKTQPHWFRREQKQITVPIEPAIADSRKQTVDIRMFADFDHADLRDKTFGSVSSDLAVATRTGGVEVTAILDGRPWPTSGFATINYEVKGPKGALLSTVPTTLAAGAAGRYSLNYLSGGPLNAVLVAVQPCASSAAPSSSCTVIGRPGERIRFSLHFESTALKGVPPAITSTPPTNALVGKRLSYQILASDPEGTPLSYNLVSGPPGVSVSPQGRVEWWPSESQVGTHTLALRVSDLSGLSSDHRFTLTVSTVMPTQSMNTARYLHTATLLDSGLLLVVGGDTQGNGQGSTSVEIYDPNTRLWRSTRRPEIGGGPLSTNKPRRDHTATKLHGGNVLIAGGAHGSSRLSSVELFNPQTERFTEISALNEPRSSHAAALLDDGRVIVAGGYQSTGVGSIEIFTPITGSWTKLRHLLGGFSGRPYLSIAVLGGSLKGYVLITGGAYVSSADLLDTINDRFSPLMPMLRVRASHAARTLPDGSVVLIGGNDGVNGQFTSELYDPMGNGGAGSSTLLPDSVSVGAWFPSSIALPGGDILVAGGQSPPPNPPDGKSSASVQVFRHASNSFTSLSPMLAPKVGFPMVLLPDLSVMFVGGATVDPQAALALSGQAEIRSVHLPSFIQLAGAVAANGLFSLPCSVVPDAPSGFDWFWDLSTGPWGEAPRVGYLGGSGFKPCRENGYTFDLSSPSLGIPQDTLLYLTVWPSNSRQRKIVNGHVAPDGPIYFGLVYWDGIAATAR